MESAVMQMNEFVGKVRQGTRPPDMDRAPDDARATHETRAERRGVDESRRAGTRPATTRMPLRYGAGF
jgi:hypothetical protein